MKLKRLKQVEQWKSNSVETTEPEPKLEFIKIIMLFFLYIRFDIVGVGKEEKKKKEREAEIKWNGEKCSKTVNLKSETAGGYL